MPRAIVVTGSLLAVVAAPSGVAHALAQFAHAVATPFALRVARHLLTALACVPVRALAYSIVVVLSLNSTATTSSVPRAVNLAVQRLSRAGPLAAVLVLPPRRALTDGSLVADPVTRAQVLACLDLASCTLESVFADAR